MHEQTLAWGTEQLPEGVLRIAFTGRGGFGSDGNSDGERMREAIRGALAQYSPKSLVIDLRDFEFSCGDWICPVLIQGMRSLGPRRVCVLTSGGESAAALTSLWEITKLSQLIPFFSELGEALAYLSRSGGVAPAAE